jgi:hypothetical protein
MALTKATYSMISGAVVNVKDYGAVGNGIADDTAAIQAAIDSGNLGLSVFLAPGTYKVTNTIFLRRNKVRIFGAGPGVSMVQFVNASGGILFSGDTNKTASLLTYSSCALENFEVISSGLAANDATVVVDLTSFSYGHFNIEAQTRRVGGTIYYGQSNAGTSPYFNHIESTGLFGGVDQTQKAFRFEGGAWTGGSSGPNANMIGPITRAASFDTVFELKVGQGNMFSNIGAESIAGTYILLGGNAAVVTGTSSGSNTSILLKDTTKSWTTNQFTNGAVQITGGVGAGQIRRISTNTATQLELRYPWATIPDATSQYSIYNVRSVDNKFVNLRQEGSGTSEFVFAFPDSDSTEITQTSIQSAGGYLDDRSCSPLNKFYGQSRSVLQYTFTTPGASANINAYPKASVFGGVKFANAYVVDWVFVECTATSHGDVANVRVDCGGTTVGGGSPTFAISIPNGESAGSDFPSLARVQKDGTNQGVFLNLQTGAAFSAGVSVLVTIGVTMVGT